MAKADAGNGSSTGSGKGSVGQPNRARPCRVLVASQADSRHPGLTALGQWARAERGSVELLAGTGPEDLSDRGIDLAVLYGPVEGNSLQAWSRAVFPRPLIVVGALPGCQGKAEDLCAFCWSGVYITEEPIAALRRALQSHRLRQTYRFEALEDETSLHKSLAPDTEAWRDQQPSLAVGAYAPDGTLVARAGLVEPAARTGTTAEIARIAVAEAHRRQGLAQELIQGLVYEARRRGADKLVLTSPGELTGLFERCGFVRLPGPFTIMERDLRDGRDPFADAP